MQPTAISRRIEDAIYAAQANDFERAAINVFPALDKTAKMAHPRIKGVGDRIERFINEHEGLITFISTKNAFIGCTYDGQTLARIIYKLGRCSIAHEGELDSRLTFDGSKPFTMGGEKWNFNPGFMLGLIISVVVNPVNSAEKIDSSLGVILEGSRYSINSLWGQRDKLLLSEGFSRMSELYRRID